MEMIDQFEAQDAYSDALAASKIALTCAKSLRNGRLVQSAGARQKQVRDVSEKFDAIQPSLSKLQSDPSDAAANREVGQYLCFWRGRWQSGLNKLASCDDAQLSKAAAMDLATRTSESALAAGDQWWTASEGLDPHESKQARARAVMLYLRAREKTGGLHRRRIEQRISEVDIEDIAYLAQRIFDVDEDDPDASEGLRHGHVNSIGMKLIQIPSGQFFMGTDSPVAAFRPPGFTAPTVVSDESPRHSVRISKPFYMGVFEVTATQFATFVRESGYVTEARRDGGGGEGWDPATKSFAPDPAFNWMSPGYPQSGSHPVVLVSYNDAVAFCEWLSKREGRKYRLPYEAEWEYACRAGTQTRFQHGKIVRDIERFANVFDEGSARFLAMQKASTDGDDAFLFTAPVGSFLPNRFGLFDMIGNAREWCQDWYSPTYYATSPAVDPAGPTGGAERVMRGGSFFGNGDNCRPAARIPGTNARRSALTGFRVVLESDGV